MTGTGYLKSNLKKLTGLKALFVFIFSLGFYFSFSQNQQAIDSLIILSNKAGDDTNKVKLINELANHYPYINPDEGIRCGRQALELAQKLSWLPGIADAYTAMGANYVSKSDYANALDNDYKALKLYEQLNDRQRQATILQNIGIVHHRNRNPDKALEYDLMALEMHKALDNKKGVAAVYSNIANVYYRLKEKEKVIEYNMKALHMYGQIADKGGVARVTGNIANFYAEYGDYPKAMIFYFDALRKEAELDNKNGITRNQGNIGETYLDIFKDYSDSIKPDSLIPRGKAANLQKALDYLTGAVANSKELDQTDYYLAFAETLSEALKLSGNTEKAFELYKEYIAVRDSVYDVEKYNAATRKEMNYEYGKREDSITYQKQLSDVKFTAEKKSRARDRVFYSAGLALVIVFSGFMYNRWRVTQRQKVVIEKEKKRSDDLLLNILPSQTAEELKTTGSAKAKDFDVVTVMFTDFKNFTLMSEQLNAQELVNEINSCYSAFDNIITKYGIEKIKTIGDSYMCAGGLPVANNTNAADIVNAALEIREYMLSEKETRQKEGKPFFEIRIGCHTGPVVAGIVGVKKFAYDIWGDTVNIASRMESSGEPGKINISGTTYELVKDKFTCTHRGKITAKNKGEVDMYFVERSFSEV